MIRFNFINEFKKIVLDSDYFSKLKSFSNEDLSELNKIMYEKIKKDFHKEIPYIIIEFSEDKNRSILKYIPNKDLSDRTFKKHGVQHKFTENLKDYVKLEEIPLCNFYYEIDAGEIKDLNKKLKEKEIKEGIFKIEGNIEIENYMNTDPKEAVFKINDLDDMSFFSKENKGLYFFKTDSEGITSIIMFEVKDKIYSLNYVTTASRARGKGHSLEIYREAMKYIVENDGILIRSTPTELGSAFIENKITKMLETEFPNEPVLSDKTKDVNFFVRMLSHDLDKNKMINLKKGLLQVLDNRSYVEKFNILGECYEYKITEEMTERDKLILTNSIKKNERKAKIKVL
jgi:hypothetical protein